MVTPKSRLETWSKPSRNSGRRMRSRRGQDTRHSSRYGGEGWRGTRHHQGTHYILTQVLEQVSPKDSDVVRTTAVKFPQKNRNSRYLPRECVPTSPCTYGMCISATLQLTSGGAVSSDRCRTTSTHHLLMSAFCMGISPASLNLSLPPAGLQAEERLGHSSGSNGHHPQ